MANALVGKSDDQIQALAAEGCRRVDADEGNECCFYEPRVLDYCPPCQASDRIEIDENIDRFIATNAPAFEGVNMKEYMDRVRERDG